jgi:UDP-N-acetyl-D-glucosamine dehydrogenase
MPLHVVQKVSDALNDAGLPIKQSRLLLLGLAYKANVHDTRESPSLEVMRQLIQRGGDVRYCDPWVDHVELDGELHRSVPWSADEVQSADCVIVLTQHRQFLEQPLWDGAKLVVDTRNVVPPGPTVYSI